MGYRELVESLRRGGEEKVLLIRQAAAEEAGRIREEADARMQALQEDYARRRVDAVAEAEGRLAAESRRQAERIRLRAENLLLERMYGLAVTSLAGLRDERYVGQFDRLAGELLPCAWETVRVNPADVALARSLFPGARIETDGAISGGMRVSVEEGRLVNDNTFEKRLERRWPELAADVAADVLRLV